MRLSASINGHRRRVALVLIALLHLGMGTHLVIQAPARGTMDRAVIHELFPLWLRVALWVGAGATVLTLVLATRSGARSVRHEHQGWAPSPDGRTDGEVAMRAERIAWVVAVAMPVERALSFGWSVLMWIIPGWPPGALDSIGPFAVWAATAGLIYLASGWTESTKGGP